MTLKETRENSIRLVMSQIGSLQEQKNSLLEELRSKKSRYMAEKVDEEYLLQAQQEKIKEKQELI